MMNLSLNNFKKFFTHSCLEYLLILLLMFILIKLGFWQLHRAHEKRAIILQFQEQQRYPSLVWTTDMKAPVAYQKIKVDGKLLKQRLFLDNQFYQHQIGYHLIVPIKIQNKILLVDAGWVRASNQRNKWPTVDIKNQKIWEGVVYFPLSSKVTYLNQLVDHQQGHRMGIELLDIPKITRLLQGEVLPWVLRLDKDDSQLLKREWPLVSLSPEKHYAYAAQWFFMAFIAAVILLWRMIKKNEK